MTLFNRVNKRFNEIFHKIPYVDVNEYMRDHINNILNSVTALFKIIINIFVIISWWFIIICIFASLGLHITCKYIEFGEWISEYLYYGTLNISSKILDGLHYICPNHYAKRTILDRGTGEPYLHRHYLLLKDRDTFPFNVFLHKFIQGDNDDIHDHPWDFFHIIISGGYWEYVPKNINRSTLDQGVTKVWRHPGYYNMCTTDYKHRIILGKEKPWTIFIPFKRIEDWGFWIPIIWQTGAPCIESTIVDGDHLNNTQWKKIQHETYLKKKYPQMKNN